MLRKSTILAIAASAVLGLTTLTPNIASAAGVHGGGGKFHGGGISRAGGFHGGGKHVFHGGQRFHGGHFKGQFRRIGHFQHHKRWHRHRHITVRWRGCWNHPYWKHCWRHRPVWYYPQPVVYGVAKPVVAAGPCTCLSKEYTPEGAVLFKDNCTNEMAMNPPALAPAAEVGPTEKPQAAYVPQYPPQVSPTSTQ